MGFTGEDHALRKFKKPRIRDRAPSKTQKDDGVWKRVASQMMEKSPPRTRKRMFSLFFSCLFLRVNTKQEARLLYEYLLHTWGGVRAAARDGARAWGEGRFRPRHSARRRGGRRGGGGGGARGARRGRGGGRNCPRGPSLPTRLRYRLPGPTACQVLHATSPPPRLTDRETETPGKGWGFGGK